MFLNNVSNCLYRILISASLFSSSLSIAAAGQSALEEFPSGTTNEIKVEVYVQ